MLDLCSSWISHFPPELEREALAGKNAIGSNGGEDVADAEQGPGLEVVGLGMNKAELEGIRLPIRTVCSLDDAALSSTPC